MADETATTPGKEHVASPPKVSKAKEIPKKGQKAAPNQPFVGISLALDTFGGEATCSSPDVVAVSSDNRACFVAF